MTMREVAAAAGVSLKTVSRVFNEDPHVLPDTRARVQKALADLRYTPNSLAITFRAGKSDVIGLALPDITDPFFAAIAKAAERTASSRGMSVLVTSLGDDATREYELIEALLRRQIQGLVVAPISNDQAYLGRFVDRTPIVFVDRPPVGLRADSFSDDDRGGTLLAMQHLLSHGCRKIAFIGETPHLTTSEARFAGYREALHTAGLEFDERLVALHVSTREEADAAVVSFLEQGPIDGIFSCSPRCSMVLVPALRNRSIAAVGFGDFPMADMVQPSMTVIDQDPEELGRLAVGRLFARMDAPRRRFRRRTTLPVRLIERSSCTVPPASSPRNVDA